MMSISNLSSSSIEKCSINSNKHQKDEKLSHKKSLITKGFENI
jgi:hypothetical protein